MVEGERAVANLAELHARLETVFRPGGAFVQAGKYMAALMSDLPRKNGWTVAEHAGDPRRTGPSGCSTTRCGTRSGRRGGPAVRGRAPGAPARS